MKIYIDIDGVLLTKSMEIPEYAAEFIHYLTSVHDCYWLTTHCRTGENKSIQYLSQYYSAELIEQLKLIQPTDWTSKKTEGIDFSSDFIWLDDYPFNAEKDDLLKNNCLDTLIVVDLTNKNELQRVKKEIKRRTL